LAHANHAAVVALIFFATLCAGHYLVRTHVQAALGGPPDTQHADAAASRLDGPARPGAPEVRAGEPIATGPAEGAARALMQDKDKYATQLAEEDRAITEFKLKNPGVSLSAEKGNVSAAVLARCADALAAAHLATDDAVGNYNLAQSDRNDPAKLRQLAVSQKYGGAERQDTQISVMQNQLNDAEARLDLNRTKLGSNAPAVVRDKQLAAGLRTRIQADETQFAQEYLSSVQNDLQSARAKEKALQDEYEFLKVQNLVRRMDVKTAQLARLVTERDATSRIVTGLDDRIKQLGVVRDYTIPNVATRHPALHGIVKKVAGAAITVSVGTGDAEKNVVVQTDDKTKFTVDQNLAKLEDVKAGDSVVIAPAEGVARHIEVNTAPKKGPD
jgi:hypothetical protein